MINKIYLFVILITINFSIIAQNTGINTTSPTNTLHIVPLGGTEPLRIEGLNTYSTNDTMLLITNNTTGVVRSISYNELSNIIKNKIDTDIDSMYYLNDTLYLLENNITLKTKISLDTNTVNSLIYAQYDSAYNFTTDSILNDTTFASLLDSVLSLYGNNIYFNDSTYSLITDSLLKDSLTLNAIADSIDSDIDSVSFANDTIYIYEDDKTVSTYINTSLDTALVNTLIIAQSDSLYSIITDSLNNDITWIKQLDSLLSIHGDTIYFNDSSYSLITDSLLKDTNFLNTLADSIDSDIDSVSFANDKIYIYEDGKTVSTYINTSLDTALVNTLIIAQSDSLYSIITDSLNNDTTWIKQLDSLLSIHGDTIYFNDSSYSLITDSLLKDTNFLNALADSIDSDVDSLILSGDTTLTIYENGKKNSVYLEDLDSTNELIDSIFMIRDSIVIIEGRDTNYAKITDNEPWIDVITKSGADNNSLDIFYNGGNVGIGTNVPFEKLHLHNDTGDTRIRIASDPTNNNENSNPGISLFQDGSRMNGYIGYSSNTLKTNAPTFSNPVFDQTGNTLLLLNNDIGIKTTSTIQLGINDTIALTVSNNRNLGIGTNNPSEKLHIKSNSTSNYINLENNLNNFLIGNTNNNLYIRRNDFTGNNIFSVFEYNGNVLMTPNRGNFGVNTVSPLEKFHVDAANDSLQFENLAGIGTILGIDANGKVFKTNGDTNSLTLVDADGDTKVQVEESADDDHIRFDTRGNERMVIDTNGNVGVGTTSPIAKMHIDQNLITPSLIVNGGNAGVDIAKFVRDIGTNGESFTFSGANDDALLRIDASNSVASDTAWAIGVDNSNNRFTIFNSTNFPSNNDDFSILPNGNIGIGTATPNSKLTINDGDILLEKNYAKLTISNQASGNVHFGSSGRAAPTVGTQDYGFYNGYNAYRDATGAWKHSRTNTVGAVRSYGGIAFPATGQGGFSWDKSPQVGTANIVWDQLMYLNLTGQLQLNQYTGTNFNKTAANHLLLVDTATGEIEKTPISNLTNSAITTITTNLTATTTHEIILVDATSSAITVTLPTAIGNTGKKFRIKKTDATANNMTVNTTGGQTIDGVPSQTTNVPYNGYVLVSDGANWFVIGKM